jgi:hypothetical protein
MIVSDKEIVSVTLDPKYETADADMFNNFFPRRILESRFDLAKQRVRNRRDMLDENLTEVRSIEDYRKEKEKKQSDDESSAARKFDDLVKEYQ